MDISDPDGSANMFKDWEMSRGARNQLEGTLSDEFGNRHSKE